MVASVHLFKCRSQLNAIQDVTSEQLEYTHEFSDVWWS